MWLGIHKYIYSIQSSGCGQDYLDLSYDADFLASIFGIFCRHLQKQQIDSLISSTGFIVWLLSFDPKIFWANQITRLFHIKYL